MLLGLLGSPFNQELSLARASAARSAQTAERTACPESAVAVLKQYLTRDTAGARRSYAASKRSGIDTLTWDPDHYEPGYDGAAIVTGFSLTCLSAATDSAVISVKWQVIGSVYSGDPVEWKREIEQSDVVLKKLQSVWRLWGRALGPHHELWFPPHIGTGAAISTSPWLGKEDQRKLRSFHEDANKR
jgi:hypothetical protein